MIFYSASPTCSCILFFTLDVCYLQDPLTWLFFASTMFLGKESAFPPYFEFYKAGLGGSRRKLINKKEIVTYRFFQFNRVVFSYTQHFVVLDSWQAKKKKVHLHLSVLTIGSNQTKVSIKYHLYSKTMFPLLYFFYVSFWGFIH